MHGNVPVRFGRGRLDSLGNKGLAAYLIRRAPTDGLTRGTSRSPIPPGRDACGGWGPCTTTFARRPECCLAGYRGKSLYLLITRWRDEMTKSEESSRLSDPGQQVAVRAHDLVLVGPARRPARPRPPLPLCRSRLPPGHLLRTTPRTARAPRSQHRPPGRRPPRPRLRPRRRGRRPASRAPRHAHQRRHPAAPRQGQILLLVHRSRSRAHQYIAANLGVSTRTVPHWLNAYLERGLGGLTPKKAEGATPRIPAELAEAIRRWVGGGPA